MTQEIVRVHEGEREQFTTEEYAEEGGSLTMASLLASGQAKIEEDTLADEVRHNDYVVERALEEDDVYFAEIRIPGWFVIDDDDLSEEFDVGHPGATLEVRGLIEDYSDGAWRIIAKETDSMAGDQWFNYAWCFVPKSVSTLTFVPVEGEEDAWEFKDEAHEVRKANRVEFDEDAGWEEKLEEIEG